MALIVQKYGGSSVATPERLKRVAQRVAENRKQGNDLVVVVSAMGDTTDEFLDLTKQITNRPSPREMDMLLSTGEQISIALLAMALHEMGEQAVSLTGYQVGILTDDVHRKARIAQISTDRIRSERAAGNIVIVAGFQGMDQNNDITTLGRGGSDTTAVALAGALEADSCEIYTDVDGIYTADPRVVPQARKLDVISYDEIMEMSSLGAQVMQLRSVEHGKSHGVEIHVRSSFNNNPGTIIREVNEMNHHRPVIGVAHDLKTAKLSILDVPDQPGIAYQVFSALAKEAINVDMIIQTAPRNGKADISFTVHEDDRERAQSVVSEVARKLGASGVMCNEGVAKISVVGVGMTSQPGVAATMFGCLAKHGINIDMIGCSEIKISCIVRADQAKEAAQALHTEFGLDAE